MRQRVDVGAVLDAHLAALQAGGVWSDEGWLAQRPLPSDKALALLPLLYLARHLHLMLTPVPPSPDFRQALYQSLMKGVEEKRPFPWKWVTVVAFGSLLSVTGVSWWLRRRLD
jgi:hypothetical protein